MSCSQLMHRPGEKSPKETGSLLKIGKGELTGRQIGLGLIMNNESCGLPRRGWRCPV